ncbi:MAG: ribosome maturation factor RimP [Deltaproteobacteria bacterium]|nr:ribosome maturation factor RimP [Deltaproteobacteria bacterium]
MENILTPLGYEVVALEQSVAGGRKLTLYIDFLNNEDESRRIGLQDCVEATKAVDELFETTELVTGNYTLDVSSPGVERPLRKAEDYNRFSGKKVKLHTFRPLEKRKPKTTLTGKRTGSRKTLSAAWRDWRLNPESR